MTARVRAVCLAVAPLVLGGCLTSRAQLDRRQSFGGEETYVAIADVPVHGFYVYVEAFHGTERYITEGELLAVGTHSLTILDDANSVMTVPRSEVVEVHVEVYDQDTGGFVLWTVLGGVSTLSHGFFLILSAPIWTATGVASAVNAEKTDDFMVRGPADINQLTQFARFPQGLPPGFRPERVAVTPEWLGQSSAYSVRAE